MPALPDKMRCVEIAKPGGPDAMAIGHRPLPQPNAGEVLIEVHATSVNRLDVFQREGVYPIPPGASDILGLDVAGIIAGLGAGVTGWAIGDKVCALLTGGGYAEYCTSSTATCLPIPAGLGMVEAATLPETMFTVWSNIFDRCHLQPGESLLVHAGSSGIGSAAIQVAHQLGARVFTTAGSAEKCAHCVSLGAELAVNYKDADFVALIKAATGGKGVDVVLDMVGGDYLKRNIDVLAIEGRLVQIALLGGDVATIDYGPVMFKRLTLTGSTLRARPPEFKRAIRDQLAERVWPLLAAGKIKPIVSRIFDLDQVAEAHRFIVSGENIGKIGIRLRPDQSA